MITTFLKKTVSHEDSGIKNKNFSNTELLNTIYEKFEVSKFLGKANKAYIVEIINEENGLPIVTFIFNKGFVRNKVLCVICFHKFEDKEWNSEMTAPYYLEENGWKNGKFKTKVRDKEFYSFVESDFLWK